MPRRSDNQRTCFQLLQSLSHEDVPPSRSSLSLRREQQGPGQEAHLFAGPSITCCCRERERSPVVSSAPVKRRKSNKERYIKVKRSWAAGQKNRKRREKIVRNIPSQQIQAVRRPVLSHIRRAESTSAKAGPERRKELIARSRCG